MRHDGVDAGPRCRSWWPWRPARSKGLRAAAWIPATMATAGREGIDEGPRCGAGGRGLEPGAAAEGWIPGEHGNGRAQM